MRHEVVLSYEALAQTSNQGMDIARRRKKSCVTRHPAHCVSIVVMDFATENFFSPRAIFSGRNHFIYRLQSTHANLSEIDKTGRAKIQRFEDFFLTEAIKRVAG